MHFCLIDDDPHLLDTLCRGLLELGHECETFASSTAGLERLLDGRAKQPDVLLLDVMMPEMDGWELLGRLRAAHHQLAVIFVSAKGEVDDRVHGLELSADDYVVKPFALRELLARSESVLRRRGFSEPVRLHGLVVDRTWRRVEVNGTVVEMSPREYSLMELLASEVGRVWSRPELLERLWNISFDPKTNVVDVLVARVRKRLGAVAGRSIETVVGQGYRLSVEAPSEAEER